MRRRDIGETGFSVIALILVLAAATVAYLKLLPEVVGFTPEDAAQDLPKSTAIHITFSRQMDQDSVQERLSITPAVPGRFEWQDRTLIFTPADPWPPGTAVSVELEPGARSSLGLLLRAGASFTFRVSPVLLVYLWPVGEEADLYALDPLTGEIHQWTEGGGVLAFDVDPEGRLIYYSAANARGGSDLFLLDRYTDRTRLLLDCGGDSCTSPLLSPAAGHLAYQINDAEIWVFDLAESASRQVSARRHAARLPLWAADGTLSFYDADRAGFVLVDVQGKEIAFFENLTGEAGTWSPAEMRFVAPELFTGVTDILRGPTGEASNQEVDPSELEPVRISYSNLLLYRPQTSGFTLLTHGDDVEDLAPAFSLDGGRIVFARRYLDEYRWTPGRQVWVMYADGSIPRQLTHDPNYLYTAFAWHPQGRQVAAVRFNTTLLTDPPEIWLLGLDGEALRLVIGGFSPQWIP